MAGDGPPLTGAAQMPIGRLAAEARERARSGSAGQSGYPRAR